MWNLCEQVSEGLHLILIFHNSAIYVIGLVLCKIHWTQICGHGVDKMSKKTSKLCITGLCVENSPVTGEFPAQKASYTESVSIWWCHHDPIIDLSQTSSNTLPISLMINSSLRSGFLCEAVIASHHTDRMHTNITCGKIKCHKSCHNHTQVMGMTWKLVN